MDTATQTILDTLFGRWRSRILYAGTRLGVFETLNETPRSAGEIAPKLEVDSAMLYRLLRALASIGMLIEHADFNFTLSDSGRLLSSRAPNSLRDFVLLQESPEHYAIWKHLPEMVRTGEQNGFVHEYGKMAFDYAAQNTEYRLAFKRAMSSFSTVQSTLVVEALASYDFGPVQSMCDVGGGQGHLLCSFLARYPHLRGSVLDLAQVFDERQELWADRLGVADRCTYVPGNMFEQVPSADAYLLKLILHDWNDAECVAILNNLREAAQAGARVFIIERVVRDPSVRDFSKLYDVHMMCWGSGRERTREEYARLLSQAGWRLQTQRSAGEGQIDILEGVLA